MAVTKEQFFIDPTPDERRKMLEALPILPGLCRYSAVNPCSASHFWISNSKSSGRA
jgi:hypothetical protein